VLNKEIKDFPALNNFLNCLLKGNFTNMKRLLIIALFPLFLALGSCAGGYYGVSTGPAYPYYGGPAYGGVYYRSYPHYYGHHGGGWGGYHGGGGYYGGHAGGNWGGGHYGGHHH
jgi:hypothetical protein